MSTLKTKIDNELVLTFLKSNFAPDIQLLTAIKEGETSQAFSFSSETGDFVIRVHSKKYGFEKDKYAYDHFNSQNIPIPKTLQIGQLNNNFYYSITQKADGKIIDHFEKEEVRQVIPQLVNVLDSIHDFNIGDTQFGDWKIDGKASETSWKEYLLKLIEKFKDHENKTFEGTLLEQDIVHEILVRYKQLIDYCPNIRHLVHGDYGFNNLLSNGKNITGVIDWELSKYGDFLYDVAWLSFWETTIDYADIFLKHYQEKNVSVPNFRERILCYKLHFGLGALRFFSDSEQEKSYTLAKERLLGLL
ncbi:MAG: aminoglycoside phosphotransferase family protein [Minisyncoccota bacterium]